MVVRKMLAIKGMTLLELMIALSVGIVLLGMMSSVYVITERQRQWRFALTKVQANLHLATQILERELRLAGFIGCARLDGDLLMANSTPYAITAKNQLEIDQDHFTSRHRSVDNAILLESMTNDRALSLSGDLGVSTGEVLLISDCDSADVFQVAAVSTTSSGRQMLFTASPLQKSYQIGAEVGRLEINTYAVAGDRLYMRDRRGRRTVLVDSIGKMNVRQESATGISLLLTLVEGPISKVGYAFVTV